MPESSVACCRSTCWIWRYFIERLYAHTIAGMWNAEFWEVVGNI